MRLLTEVWEDAPPLEYLFEGKGENKQLYLEGVYISTNRRNKNGRLYKRDLMENIIEDFNQNKVEKGIAFGELGHSHQPSVDLARISHRIQTLRWDGDDVVGRSIVIQEGMGKILSGILQAGGKVSFSSRGLGDVKQDKNGDLVVQPNYKLIAIDNVLEASTGQVANAIEENHDFIWDDSVQAFRSAFRSEYHRRSPLNEEDLLEEKFALFSDFLRNLAKRAKGEGFAYPSVFRRQNSRKERKGRHIITNPHDATFPDSN